MDLFVKLVLSVLFGGIVSFAFFISDHLVSTKEKSEERENEKKECNKKKWLTIWSCFLVVSIFSIIFFLLSWISSCVLIALGVASICFLLGAIIGVAKQNNNYVNYSFVLGGVIFFVAIIVLIWFFLSFNPVVIENEKVLTGRVNLIAITDNTMISGKYYLFSGGFIAARVYEYYYELPTGGSLYESVPAKNIPVYEECRTDGFIGNFQTRDKKKWPGLYQFIYSVPEEEYIVKDSFQELHVPIGTIKREMNIDLGS